MGIAGIDKKSEVLFFVCEGCKINKIKNGDQAKKYKFSDMHIRENLTADSVGIELPICSECNSRSYVIPGPFLRGPKIHLRAILLKCLYEKSKKQDEFPKTQELLRQLEIEYENVATDKAKKQFMEKSTSKKELYYIDCEESPLK